MPQLPAILSCPASPQGAPTTSDNNLVGILGIQSEFDVTADVAELRAQLLDGVVALNFTSEITDARTALAGEK